MDDKQNALRDIEDIRPDLMPSILTYVSEIAALIVKLYDLLDEELRG